MFADKFNVLKSNLLRQIRYVSREQINEQQASYLNEKCIRVNNNDEPLGMISKEDCHRNCMYVRVN